MLSGAKYEFVTQWQIPAPLERVWHELMHPEQWPIWWRGVEQVQLRSAGHDELGVGAIRHYTFRSRLPYRLSFAMQTTSIVPMSLIEGHASGELEGCGVWRLRYSDRLTHVRYDWHVVANKWWMRWLSPVARPVFEWNHDVIMNWGRVGLLRRLECL